MPVRPARTRTVLAVVLGALVTGLVAALRDGKPSGPGTYVLLGLMIVAVAVGCGVALAKAINRQGRG
jgi:hypothetical protein